MNSEEINPLLHSSYRFVMRAEERSTPVEKTAPKPMRMVSIDRKGSTLI